MADISIQMARTKSGAWVVMPLIAGTGKHGKWKRFSEYNAARSYARKIRLEYEAKGHKARIQRLGE
jgi:hypothetical protein